MGDNYFKMIFPLGVENKRQYNERADDLKSEVLRDGEDKLNNPQPSVIRGHRRSRATFFSFVLEDAAPQTLRAWSNLDR